MKYHNENQVSCQKIDFAIFHAFSQNSKDNHGGSSCGGGIRICIRFFKKVQETLLHGAQQILNPDGIRNME